MLGHVLYAKQLNLEPRWEPRRQRDSRGTTMLERLFRHAFNAPRAPGQRSDTKARKPRRPAS